LISASDEEIREKARRLDNQTKGIKEDIYKIAWYMRGGVSSSDLLWKYSVEDRELMSKVIKTNIENTKNTKLPLL
jgi:hypothetical protein